MMTAGHGFLRVTNVGGVMIRHWLGQMAVSAWPASSSGSAGRAAQTTCCRRSEAQCARTVMHSIWRLTLALPRRGAKVRQMVAWWAILFAFPPAAAPAGNGPCHRQPPDIRASGGSGDGGPVLFA